MKEEDRRRIEEIVDGMQCPKDFQCVESGFERMCKAKDFGLESYLECLDGNPQGCPFSLSFGEGHFCRCPLRVYLSKNLKR